MTNKDAQKIIFAFCNYSNAVDKLHLGDKQRKLVDKLAKKFHRTFRRAINNQNKNRKSRKADTSRLANNKQ